MQWLPTRFYGSLSVCSRPLPSEKIAPLQPSYKSPFGDSCLIYKFSLDSTIELRERKPAAVCGTYLRDTTKQNLDPVAGKIPYFMKAPKR